MSIVNAITINVDYVVHHINHRRREAKRRSRCERCAYRSWITPFVRENYAHQRKHVLRPLKWSKLLDNST